MNSVRLMAARIAAADAENFARARATLEIDFVLRHRHGAALRVQRGMVKTFHVLAIPR